MLKVKVCWIVFKIIKDIFTFHVISWILCSRRRPYSQSSQFTCCLSYSGIILCMRPANESRCYNVTLSLIGWAHTQNDSWALYCQYLILNVRGPSYLGLTKSISWLLMPWLLTSPAHQQPWYWLCRIGRFLSYLRKDFNYLCHINVEKWHKI